MEKSGLQDAYPGKNYPGSNGSMLYPTISIAGHNGKG